MDPTNFLHLKTVPSENGLKPVENPSDNLLDMACESPFSGKVKFMCSFGGKILPRPSDGKLRYVGGETRLISINRSFSWKELMQKTLTIYCQPHIIKYQLPDEDLDALISLSCDEDFQNMMEEYDTLEKANGSVRLRIFLVSLTECEDPSLDSKSLESEPEYHFVAAVNNLAHLDRSISGNNLMSQSNHQFYSSPVPYGDSPLCPTNTETGAKDSVGATLNEPSSQFFLAPYTQQMVAELSTTSSPSLGQQRTMQQSRMQPPADESTRNHEHVNRSEICNGLNLKAMPPGHLNKKQNDADRSIGTGPPMHHPHIERQVKGLAGNDSDLISRTNYDISTPVEASLYSEKASVHAENAGLAPGLQEPTAQILGMPHAFSDPLIKNINDVPASNLSLPADSYITQSFSDKICQTNELERTISRSRPAFECVKLPDIARTDETNYLVSNHIDQQYGQGVIGSASSQAPVSYQHENLSSNVTRKGHDGGPVIQQQDKCYHLDKNAGPIVAPCSNFVDAGLIYHTRDARLSSDELDALESSVPKPMCATDHSLSYLLNVSQGGDSNPGSHIEKLNSGPIEYGTTGYGHGNDKVAPEPHILLPVNTSEAFALQRSMVNGEASVYQNGNLRPSSVHNSGLAASPHIGLIDTDLSMNLHGNGGLSLSSSQNPVTDGVPRRDDLIRDCGNIACTEGVIGFDRTVISNESIKLPHRMHDNAQIIVPFIVEDVTDNVPLGIPSSSSGGPQVVIATEERQEVIISSQKDDDTRSIEPEFATEDHDGAVDGSISDAVVAELEASMYGLQIIKNGDLEELRELGSGTFGTVYYGKWRGTDVAIKRIKKSCFAGRSSEQEKLTNDFWREAQILSKLHHPNVVAFYGVVPDGTGGTLATVTEFMVNGSLRNVLLRKDRMLDRRRKLTIAMDAAFGMEYLHSKSIVHFDLKCDNLLVNLRDPQRPICKVGDFGLSRIKRNTLVSGGVRGTLPWMAPELLNGSSSRVSEKVDVFSFGIVLWEILTGEEPYANMHCGAIIGGIVNNTLRPPIPENCDPDWRKLMEQCWSANPDARPSFTEVTDRLRAMPSVLQSRGQAPGTR
ncbi:hypothetical protein PAHAL_3G482700 [Panicum hallii]|uniref:Protein kinase domain-containing protein n=1 Tax=Panicum hallii TaxID=206008 RepID=A0A2S3HF38_9POAL|nr:uncharacterized protein LOC112884821 isoform X1 [Panicum hallii]PAN21673.1 hypothetical protein PAHAL_3G482700 [Panicum hallii]